FWKWRAAEEQQDPSAGETKRPWDVVTLANDGRLHDVRPSLDPLDQAGNVLRSLGEVRLQGDEDVAAGVSRPPHGVPDQAFDGSRVAAPLILADDREGKHAGIRSKDIERPVRGAVIEYEDLVI